MRMEVGPGLAITPAFSFSRHHNERRQALDVAMHSVEQTADPQTEAAIRIVAWVSQGALKPTSNDFAMLRLA